MIKFIKREGHVKVPATHQENGFPLHLWIAHQRQLHREDKLLPEHRRLLEQLPGWRWLTESSPMAMRQREREEAEAMRLAEGMDESAGAPGMDQFVEKIWEIFFGFGAVDAEIALEKAARDLHEAGLLQDPAPKPGSEEHVFIQKIFDTAVEYGFMDVPEAGHYRAILEDPSDLEPEDWRMCLIDGMDEDILALDDAIRVAAEWARENLGIRFTSLDEESLVWKKLEHAVSEAIKANEMKEIAVNGRVLFQVVE